MTEPARLRDLLQLPDEVQKGAFVLKLAEGVENPEETVGTYVITPGLADAFDRALRLVGTALRDGRSQAAFLHGSFGSGKSHFMALLSLLLAGTEQAWRRPELHDLRRKHGFVGERRLLELHLHMVGHESLEAAIFGKYVEHVRKEHPDAPLPGLFADEQLFEDARAMLEELGDEAFFAPMSVGASKKSGFGTFSAHRPWDRARFEKATSSSDPREREDLFSALAKTRFKAFAQESRRFVDLDQGLAALARHAASLKFDGVVLFLDEIILWLASAASHPEWMHNEVQKMVKLVESQEGHREIPIISFMARQRDLAEMVGKDYEGAENARLRESLRWWEERYDTIKLEDRNLPAIVEKRVVRAKDPAALRDAFDRMKRQAGPAWQTLLGELDEEAFRKLYPFSPALVDALVALSSSLQRQRTAIRLLMEILVEHIPDMLVGDLVGVGDLFDVLAGGDDTADGVMKARFEAAKHVYRYQFLSIIQEANGTSTEARCQRLRASHPARLGCSGCGERACRTDNRLIKTLLVGALVPEVKTLHDLTASRLAWLNNGSLRVPIPGTEGAIVTEKIRHWASIVGQLHVGPQSDPTVRLQLEGVDLGPIIEQAREHDQSGSRQRVIRDLLFAALGVNLIADWGQDHKEEWRGTSRLGHIRFGNVRKLGPEQLRCPEGHDWRFVIDYPFDEPGYGPNHDLDVIEKMQQEGGGSWTLVWVPTFFSKVTNDMVGELAILEHILNSNDTTRRYVAHLSVENQSRAITDLQNLRNQKRSRILQVLEAAYGLVRPRDGDLDPSLAIDQHLFVLKPGARVPVSLAPSFETAIREFVPKLLEERWPRHPSLRKLTRNLVEDMVDMFGQLVDADDHRVPAERDLVDKARSTLGELGLVRATESAVHIVEDRILADIEKRRQQKAVHHPEVYQVRRWIDETDQLGLQIDAQDLIVRCYARWSRRTLVSGVEPYTPRPGTPLPETVVLERPDLPSQAEWAAALTMASNFGVTLAGRALHPDNLKRFEADVGKDLKAKTVACTRLLGILRRRLDDLSIDDADRTATARSAESLCLGLQGKRALEVVRFLAGFKPETSARAVGESMGSAETNASLLGDEIVFGVFAQLKAQERVLSGATELLERLAQALRQDEVNVALAARLRGLAEEGQRLLRALSPPPPAPPPPPPASSIIRRSVSARGRTHVREELNRVVSEIEQALEETGDDVMLTGAFELTRSDE
jgi:hypothetical protein